MYLLDRFEGGQGEIKKIVVLKWIRKKRLFHGRYNLDSIAEA